MNALERAIIHELQGCIPLDTGRPFAEIARRCGVNEDEVLAIVRHWMRDGVIRRFGAVVRHQSLGRTANAMSVWNVPDEKQRARVANELASFAEVSHCYERATGPGWPYQLYGMIHGSTSDECRSIAEEVSRRTGATDYLLLESTREFKKESLRYY